jgi:ribose transport system ATP-binding protein
MPDPLARPALRLRAEGIRKSFGGIEVLHGVSIDVTGGRVLALLGENGAGKSTLVRVLAGAHAPDSGTLHITGSSGEAHVTGALDPATARRLGIRMIFQELSDAPDLTVAENISLGQWPRSRGLISWRRIRGQARAVLDSLGADLDLDAPVRSLRVGERQVIEVARALTDQASCLILDEPTAALSSEEVQRLFTFIGRLRDQGVALIYITHRLDEVAAIADDVLVLRDGHVAATGLASELTRRDLVTAMVGRDIGGITRPASQGPPRPGTAPRSGTALRMRAATSPPAFRGLDLEVRYGEIVCLYGKVGSGTAEVADVIFGRRRLRSGELTVLDHRPAASPRRAIDDGVGYLAADRQREGLLATRSAGENLTAPSWPRLARHGILTSRTDNDAFNRWQAELSIRAHGGASQPVITLSGGNQQKVLLARWLHRGSPLLTLVEPTRGVDVGARADIYRVLRRLAAEGTAVLVATSDYEEVVQLADRAIVMVRGTSAAQLAGDDITTQALTDAAGG